MSKDSLAFIVGHYKSGSTWLANLLSLHPAVCGLRETHIFRYSHESPDLAACTQQVFSSVAWANGGQRNLLRHRLSTWSRPFRGDGQASLHWQERPTTLLDLSLVDQFGLKRQLLKSSDPNDYCRRFFEFLQRQLAPDRCLVDKTSTNIFWVPTIREIFPDCKLLVIHRDGRDVVVSDRYHLRNQYGREQDLEKSILNWRRAIEAQLEFRDRFGIFETSYEEMKQEPAAVTLRILEHLDLPRSEDMVEDLVHRSSFEFVTGRSAGNENQRAFYRKGVTGDWVNHLSADELRQFSALAGDLLVRLGYEESPDWQHWGS